MAEPNKQILAGAMTEAATGLIPFVTSAREWKKGNYFGAIGWGALDVAGLASLVIPVGGEAVEAGIAAAKVAKEAGVVAKVVEGGSEVAKVTEAGAVTGNAAAATVKAETTAGETAAKPATRPELTSAQERQAKLQQQQQTRQQSVRGNGEPAQQHPHQQQQANAGEPSGENPESAARASETTAGNAGAGDDAASKQTARGAGRLRGLGAANIGASMDRGSRLLNMGLQTGGVASILLLGGYAIHEIPSLAEAPFKVWADIGTGGSVWSDRDQKAAQARALNDTQAALRARGASAPPRPSLRTETTSDGPTREETSKYADRIAEKCRTGQLRDPSVCP